MSAAIVLFAFGAVTVLLSLSLPLGSLRMPGSGLFPLVLGAFLMSLAAVQIWTERRRAPEGGAAAGPRGDAPRVAAFMAVVVGTVALLPAVGYLAASFLLVLGLLRVLGVRWLVALAIAAVAAGLARVVFVGLLGIPLPAGLLRA